MFYLMKKNNYIFEYQVTEIKRSSFFWTPGIFLYSNDNAASEVTAL